MPNYTCQVYPGASLLAGSIKELFDDPVQGQPSNCCFIAALSAVAWTMGKNKIRIRDNQKASKEDPAAYTVWINNQEVNVSGKLSLDFNYPPFYYKCARSRTLSEIWPGLYEKAYAIAYHQASADSCDFTGIQWDGNPNNALQNLSGCPYRQKSANLSTEIISRCVDGKIKYPAVAWNQNHCYTVLGQRSSDGKIILRDPSLQNIPPNTEQIGSWTITNHFLWDCTINSRVATMLTLSVNLGNGLFAMRTGDVDTYFTNVTYAGPQ
ncbi:MAG: hypothetical protein A4E40_01561 [Methanoregulaceae archaeon PtaU1.Bin059]|nr:MAG: hypothetical protein A4E39_00874 [Methanoregulaceae archaeon PtaB.Bin152]OPY35988.1 MAG: hypothetical protein A4E40_01561 [Methanoregulaceae archaeon PtaU1.Bin059]